MQPQPITTVWTGGQQSLARIALAGSALLALVVVATTPATPTWLRIGAALLMPPALTLLAGWKVRASALGVGLGLALLGLGHELEGIAVIFVPGSFSPLSLGLALDAVTRAGAVTGSVAAGLLAARLDASKRAWPLVLAIVAGVVAVGTLGLLAAPTLWMVTAPPAPWGSLDAAGRVDPGGDWRRPAWHGPVARRVALALVALFALAPLLSVSGQPTAPPADLLETLGHLALGLLIAVAPLASLALPPSWAPPLPSDGLDVVFYDGHCGLCHRTVRWLLAEDADGERFAFAALGGDTFTRRLDATDRAALPDSVVVLTHDGRLLTRWRAVCHLLARLGGLWRLLGACASLVVPRRLGDALYDLVARVRLRIFGRSDDACPLLPPQLRARMLP